MRRLLSVTVTLFLFAARVQAQFTIPDNTSGSIVSSNQSIWMQSDIDTLVQGIGGQGVLSGVAVTAQGSPNMTVAVASGSVRISNAAVSVSSGNVTITAAHATLPRIDLISVNSSGVKSAIAGTPASYPGPAALPSTSVALAFVYVPAAATAINANQIVDKRVFVHANTGGAPWEVLLTDYGAVCDGSTDDATAVQAAFDAALALVSAVVIWPESTCRVDSTVILGSTVSGTDSYLGIRGASSARSVLLWGGSSTGTALRLARTKYTTMQGLGVRNNNGSPSTSVGIAQGGNTGVSTGTQTLGQTWTDIMVVGFGTGIEAGAFNGAASEILYHNLELDNNTTGWLSTDFNTLDHIFVELKCGANGICVDGGASSNFAVYGGSTTGSTTSDFNVQQSGPVLISGFRSENSNRFLTGTVGSVHLDSILAVSPSNADKVAIAGTYTTLDVTNSVIDGKIAVADILGGISIRNTKVFGAATLPFSSTTTTQIGLPYTIQNVTFHDPAASMADFLYADRVGNIFSADVGGNPTTTDFPALSLNRSSTLGDNYTLNRVKMLSQGADVAGKNLRVQTVFSTAATSAVAFTRNVTVSIDTPTLIATSGRFFPSDVGKKVILVGIGGGGANVTRFIWAYTDSTHVSVAPHSDDMQCCSNQTGVTATIGENEPDANYMLMLGCSADERFSWSSKATTGFTLTSSNASSTATCDVFIVR